MYYNMIRKKKRIQKRKTRLPGHPSTVCSNDNNHACHGFQDDEIDIIIHEFPFDIGDRGDNRGDRSDIIEFLCQKVP